jgi:hypothetical protein
MGSVPAIRWESSDNERSASDRDRYVDQILFVFLICSSGPRRKTWRDRTLGKNNSTDLVLELDQKTPRLLPDVYSDEEPQMRIDDTEN